jgi:hypothetical protein
MGLGVDMNPKFDVGDKVGHLLCPGLFFVSCVLGSGSRWSYYLRVSQKNEPSEKYWVYEQGLKDLGIIAGGRLTEEAVGICDCREENLYSWPGGQSWDSESV